MRMRKPAHACTPCRMEGSQFCRCAPHALRTPGQESMWSAQRIGFAVDQRHDRQHTFMFCLLQTMSGRRTMQLCTVPAA
eukprot:364208-Chlamydomonas_euryale.AAC.29